VISGAASIEQPIWVLDLLTLSAICMKIIIQMAKVLPDIFHIDNNGVPIYVQIRDQILAAVGAGILRPGERMPTMREVAVALKVDLNTVRHAYDSAQDTGAIILVKARGTYVADHPPAIKPEELRQKIDRLAQQTIATAFAAGINPFELTVRINEIANGQEPKGTSDEST
jgi:GntR family transcriptional regulator